MATVTVFQAAIRRCARWARAFVFGREVVSPVPEPKIGRWEVVPSSSGTMLHMRWSLPSKDGTWLWCRHYENTDWGRHAIEGECRKFNESGRMPWEFPGGQHFPVSA